MRSTCPTCLQVLPDGALVSYVGKKLWVPDSHCGDDVFMHLAQAKAAGATAILWNDLVRRIRPDGSMEWK